MVYGVAVSLAGDPELFAVMVIPQALRALFPAKKLPGNTAATGANPPP